MTSSITSAHLALRQVSLGYPQRGGMHLVVQELSLSLARGQIGCLLGASGCGKSTVLRAIAGFEPLLSGSVQLDGRLLAEPGHELPPEQRRIGMMFQDYALFPHLTVAANVGFGVRGVDRAARARRVDEMLARVGLPQAGSAYPHELSGGQQQRVALARALAPSPEVLLLDEPFSNLDVHTREHLAAEVREVLADGGHTAILVTHNHAEAFAMADRIGVMQAGRIVQWDRPAALRERPASAYVAEFLGLAAPARGASAPAA